MINGIYDYVELTEASISWLAQRMRLPTVLNVYMFAAIGTALLSQRAIRPFLTATSLLVTFVFFGLPFTSGVLGGCVATFVLARALARWSTKTASPRWPLAVGWLGINAMYIPCFLIVLRFPAGMVPGELTQFCGVAFMALKALHYVGQACRGNLDPAAAGAFARYLLYMVYLPTFRLGPYQTYAEFDGEVDTCRQRISWRNAGRGFWRIGTGVLKMSVLGLAIELPFFIPLGDNIPFAEGMYEAAPELPAGRVWLLAYLHTLRQYLFLSAITDGAIGLNLLFGIRTAENFSRPLLATNVIEFWRRWHMTVGSWMRDEIYGPLGGGRRRRTFNYWAVFTYCGVWHFAFFWGGYLFGVLQAVALAATHVWLRFWSRRRQAASPLYERARRWQIVDSVPSRLAGWLITFHVFTLSALIMFDHDHSALRMLARMFGLY